MFALLVGPGDAVFVGQNAACNGGSVIATQADHHEAESGDFSVGFELKHLVMDLDMHFARLGLCDGRVLVVVS